MTPTALIEKARRLREDFPILARTHPSGRPLIYFDNAATAQKPRVVIERLASFLAHENANIHRGVHWLSQEATHLYEKARETIQHFIGAASPEEIVFVRGATEGINLIAQGLRRSYFQPGDEIILSTLEHHANIVPWQIVAEELPLCLRPLPLTPEGAIDISALPDFISPKTRLIAISHTSNALGTRTAIEEIVALAKTYEIPVLLDACQSVVHEPIDVQKLPVDFLVFSGHKLYGPTGIGVVYMRALWGRKLPPYQGGGDMILRVSWEKTRYAPPPAKFEAGTPAIAEAIGLSTAIQYLTEVVGYDFIQAYEAYLTDVAESILKSIPGLTLYGTARPKSPIWSFGLEGVHPHDLGTFLDSWGIAIRVGHHCAQPLMDALGVPATARLSLAFYNLPEELQILGQALQAAHDFFHKPISSLSHER